MQKLAIVFALLLSFAVPSFAEDTPEVLVERWYKALDTANRSEFADLLTDDAIIVLEDQEIEQTKREFLGSLDEWEHAVKGTTIKHRLGGMENGKLTMFVCYEFPDNTTYSREIFSFRNGKISASAQGAISETCEGF
ncbi:nuclear transport factor 2 family protein [Phyllobacterium sp. P30BS-XVII]|uniref:nuclear transport factor 2 family protein n=1 Tax=Phyllobacterium sp. P30BS-XVII TaxID=2587046 RepID=UPI0015FC2819|nr:nuclear transport factor 2 family protein [Phyllobacterium sp. P30BS-XVII]MBA8899948.1 hypothetical protein [Phyllobacterium sp. P30BS-XVII]